MDLDMQPAAADRSTKTARKNGEEIREGAREECGDRSNEPSSVPAAGKSAAKQGRSLSDVMAGWGIKESPGCSLRKPTASKNGASSDGRWRHDKASLSPSPPRGRSRSRSRSRSLVRQRYRSGSSSSDRLHGR